MTRCTFCAVVTGEVEAPIVYSDERSVAFLDHRPVFIGHTLLVPRAHHETLADLPDTEIASFFGAAQLLARAVQSAMQADGSFVAINNRVSQSVAHLHVHVVPRRTKDGLRGFFWPRTSYASDDALRQTREAIRAAVTTLGSLS